MSYGFPKYVCIEHRHVVKMFRRSAHPRCPTCSQPMEMLSWYVRVPPKKDDAAWKALRSSIRPNLSAFTHTYLATLEFTSAHGRKVLRDIKKKLASDYVRR